MAATPAEKLAEPAGKKRGSYKSSELIRSKLIDAAMVEFASNGFEGASTRAIATRAGAHQPQINYHFASKDALWRAVMDRIMGELDEYLPTEFPEDPRDQMEAILRGLVHFTAGRPELNRMMTQVASTDNDRLQWLVDTHLRDRYNFFRHQWEAMRATGAGRDVPADLVYHLVIGATSLVHSNAAEAQLLADIDASNPATVEAHADAMVELFLR